MKIKLLWPIIWETWNQSNDFLYVILKTIVANSGINSHKRIKQLIRGFSLDKVPNQWLLGLDRLKLCWYSTKTNADMEMIGPIIGCFLWFKAENFCGQISNSCTPNQPSFEGMKDLFKLCQQSIKPIIVELDVVDRTITRLKNFIQITDVQFSQMKSEAFVHCSKKTTMYQILPEYEDWAWKLMNQIPMNVIIEAVPSLLEPTVRLELTQEIENDAHSLIADCEVTNMGPMSRMTEMPMEEIIETSPSISEPSVCLELPQDTESVAPTPSKNNINSVTRFTRSKINPLPVLQAKQKRQRIKKSYRGTRSQRPATVPKNTTFEWVSMRGYPYIPALIHPATETRGERAQKITSDGDLPQTMFEFSRVTVESMVKPKAAKYSLRQFNERYGTAYE